MTVSRVIAQLALVLAMSACGSSQPKSRTDAPINAPDRTAEQASDLRDAQMKLLFRFDAALPKGEGQCDTLCDHHTQICKLATRICEIADANKGHERAYAACQKANETCRETTKRLPQECWCR